jgi:hypothetical protein
MNPSREPVECPHCGEPTQPNLLADGSVVCSCAAERALPGDGAAPLEPFPFAMAHGNTSRLLFSRASSPDQVIPPDRDLP